MREPIKGIAIQHVDGDIQHAFVKLSDLIVQWERDTGRRSVLIYRELGLESPIRLVDGKPGVPDDVTDQHLLEMIEE